MQTTTDRQAIPRDSVIGAALRIVIPVDAVALLVAGVVHLTGATVPLGVGAFIEPPILPAGIVETAAGLLFALATYAVWRERVWAWRAALGAHLFAILGFVVGIAATRNGTTPFNHSFHWVMLTVFVVGLILLLLPGARQQE